MGGNPNYPQWGQDTLELGERASGVPGRFTFVELARSNGSRTDKGASMERSFPSIVLLVTVHFITSCSTRSPRKLGTG